MRSLLAALAVVAGCQSSGSKGPMADDLAKICNAVELSGAAALEPADQAYTIAMWLPANVGDEGRAWLVEWARLGEDRPARRAMLERATRAAGIRDCPLIASW